MFILDILDKWVDHKVKLLVYMEVLVFVPQAEGISFEVHGSRFLPYVAPARGSAQLCAWRLDLPAETMGTAHRVSHEEVFLVLEGAPILTINDVARELLPGDVAFFPVGAKVKVDNPTHIPAAAWVTTSVGLKAEMADGEQISPPWVR